MNAWNSSFIAWHQDWFLKGVKKHGRSRAGYATVPLTQTLGHQILFYNLVCIGCSCTTGGAVDGSIGVDAFWGDIVCINCVGGTLNEVFSSSCETYGCL